MENATDPARGPHEQVAALAGRVRWFAPGTEGRTLDDLLEFLAREAAVIMRADRSSIFLLDRDKNELWSRIALGVEGHVIRIPATRGIVGHVVTTGEPLNIPDAYEDPRFNQAVDRRTGYRTRSILCAPLRGTEGQVIGALQVLNKVGDEPFTTEDERLCEVLAAQCAAAIRQAQAAALPAPPDSTPRRPRPGAPTIMLVHPDPASLGPVRELFGVEFRVVGAVGPDEATGLADDERPALFLVMLDAYSDGLATCRALRARPATSDTPIIVISELRGAEDAAGAFAAGASDYLVKPFAPAQLRAKAHTCILRASGRR